jgi:DNA-binding SARP family transcriptional activator
LRLQLLGAAAWSRGGSRAVVLERRDAAVLAWLALEGEAPRARLLELLWPDVERDTARNHLRQRLYRLKRAVGGELVDGSELLSLAPAVQVDARDAAAPGELLLGLDYSDCPQFERWLAEQRERRRSLHIDALTRQAERLESGGHVADAITPAQQLVALAPLEEHTHRRLMRLHYLHGDRAAAIAAFEHCERLLKDELGVRPGAETLALLHTIESAAGALAPGITRTVPAALLRPPRMVGRASELAAMRDAWAAGSVAIVLGAGGLGKSRLLAELAAQLGDGHVLVRARPGDAAAPYALLARWLRALEAHDAHALAVMRPDVLAALLPERAAQPALPVTTAAIRSGCERALGAAIDAGCGWCIVDDLHCADAASLELLEQLMLADSRCRWALARRPEEGDAAADALADALAAAHRLIVVRLAALDAAALAELVESLALPQLAGMPLVESLARHTGGNPLFALETLKAIVLAGGLDAGARLPRPLGVIEAIQRRLGGLSAPAQALVQFAAVAGPDFSVALAERVLQQPALAFAGAWRELHAAQLIDGEAFVHDLVHEAALGWVPKPIRRHLCGAIARQLSTGDRARIAELWLAAGDDAQAAPALVAAADAARRAGRYAEAGQRAEQAARAYDRCGCCDAQAFEQLYRAFDDRSTTSTLADLQPLADEIVRRAHGDAQAAMASITQANIANMRCDWTAMERALVAAQASATRCSDAAIEVEARFGLGLLRYSHGEFAEAVEQIGAAAARLDAAGLALRAAELRGSLARVFHLLGRVGEARVQLDLALPVLRDAHADAELARDIGMQALLALEVGDAAAALELSERSYRLLGDAHAGMKDWLAVVGDRLQVLASANRYAEALELMATARADPRFQPSPLQARLIECEAGVLFELGRGWHAERLLAPLDAIDAGMAGYRGSRAVLALQGQSLQDRAPAAGRLHEVHELARGVPQRCRYAALAAPHLPAAQALALCTAALELAEGLGLKGHLPALLAGRADALWRNEQPDAAQHCARRALRLLETTAPLVYRGVVWSLLHRVLAATGDDASVREVLLQAGEWLHQTAWRFVPAQFRESFLSRNAVNRELLLQAARATIAR